MLNVIMRTHVHLKNHLHWQIVLYWLLANVTQGDLQTSSLGPSQIVFVTLMPLPHLTLANNQRLL